MKLAAAPFFGGDISDSLGKIPSVTIKVLSIVLALAIRVVCGFAQDSRSILPRSLAVAVSIINSYLNALRVVGRDVAFANGEAAFAGLHLYAVVGNAESHSKTEGLGKPISCRCRIGINEYRNHRTGRDRAVESHAELYQRLS